MVDAPTLVKKPQASFYQLPVAIQELVDSANVPGSTQEARKAGFLALLGERYSVTSAARNAGFCRATAYDWQDEDKAFSKAWAEATDKGARDWLEDRVRERIAEKSDVILIVDLKRRGMFVEPKPGITVQVGIGLGADPARAERGLTSQDLRDLLPMAEAYKIQAQDAPQIAEKASEPPDS